LQLQLDFVNADVILLTWCR